MHTCSSLSEHLALRCRRDDSLTTRFDTASLISYGRVAGTASRLHTRFVYQNRTGSMVSTVTVCSLLIIYTIKAAGLKACLRDPTTIRSVTPWAFDGNLHAAHAIVTLLITSSDTRGSKPKSLRSGFVIKPNSHTHAFTLTAACADSVSAGKPYDRMYLRGVLSPLSIHPSNDLRHGVL